MTKKYNDNPFVNPYEESFDEDFCYPEEFCSTYPNKTHQRSYEHQSQTNRHYENNNNYYQPSYNSYEEPSRQESYSPHDFYSTPQNKTRRRSYGHQNQSNRHYENNNNYYQPEPYSLPKTEKNNNRYTPYESSFDSPYQQKEPEKQGYSTALTPGEPLPELNVGVSSKNKSYAMTGALKVVGSSLYAPVSPQTASPQEKYLVGYLYIKVIISKDDKRSLKALQEAYENERNKLKEESNLSEKELSDMGIPSNFISQLSDGDTFESDQYDRFKNSWVWVVRARPLSHRSTIPVFDLNNNPVLEHEGISGDDDVQVLVRAACWDYMGKRGVSLFLNQVRLIRKGQYHRNGPIGFDNF